jgi:hypothetical protein
LRKVGDMNCRVCGNPLFAGRATFRCSCGAITHGYCWEKHVLESHEPPFVVGTVDLDGQFMVEEPEAEEPEPQEAEAEEAEVEEELAPALIAEGEAESD